jgi:PAS domain S-box-containing protein
MNDQKASGADRDQLLLHAQAELGRLAEVFRQAPAFMCVLRGPNHIFELLNERYAQLVGHRDLLGVAVRDALPEIEGQGFFEMLDTVYQSGEPFVGSGMRVMINRERGQPPEERYIDLLYQALKESGGSISGIVVVGVDVTDRQRTDEQLRRSEEHLRLALDAVDLGTWHIDAQTNTLSSDERFQFIFSGQAGPITYEEAFERIHPEDRSRIAVAVAGAIQVDQPVAYSEEYRVIHVDGSMRWVHGKGRAIFDETATDQQAIRLDGTVMDITAQKASEIARKQVEQALLESEERLRAATAAVSELIWTNNADGLMQGEQRGWGEFTGQSRDEYQGYGWSSAVHPDDAQATVDAWMAAVAGKRTFVFEHRLRRHDGQWRLCSVRAVPILNADGQIREWVGVHDDITERKRDDEQLRQLAAELSEVNSRKDEFLATLAHELRNPLAPIRNGLQLMKLAGGQLDIIEQTRAMMERQLTQMVRLVDDLMDVSRISQGKLELRKERVPISAVLDSAVESSRPLIEQMGHKLTITLPEQPIFLDADMTRLAQVFLNLLNNAAKYSERDGHIQLIARREGSELLVTVRDYGAGMAAGQLPRIFEMFAQIGSSQEKSQGGLGIGLNLVKRLVEMHNGQVEARSAGLGKGSEFVVRLPALTDAQLRTVDVGGEPASSNLELREPAPSASALRILIVDDSRDGANSMSEMLEIMGHDTRTAYDGQQGVDIAAQYRPDVILLDIGMPKLNGHEACRHIREQPWGKGIVLIALTGWGQDKDRERTREAGFDHHLVKPVKPQALLELLAGLDVSGKLQSSRN